MRTVILNEERIVLGVLRCVYVDLDGTLVGRGGSLLHDAAGNVSLMAARALEAAHRAGVEIVPISGRRRDTVREPARSLGATAFGFEIGGGLHVDGEDFWQTGALQPEGERSVLDRIVQRGLVDRLVEAFPGRLELHAPWHTGREVSALLRGDIDVEQAQRLLNDHGADDLRLIDNGFVGGLPQGGTSTGVGAPDRATSLHRDVQHPRSYHLAPRSVSKAAAVARHRQIRGYARADTISIGDSAEDVGMAAETDVFWLVRGEHVAADPAVQRAIAAHHNVRRADGGAGAAVYEAIVSTLMVGRDA
jgi:hydroxymethylpyrimidine pyrophosphatase-like HAD family hydrolase